MTIETNIQYFNRVAESYANGGKRPLSPSVQACLDEHVRHPLIITDKHGTIKTPKVGKMIDYCSGSGSVALSFLRKNWDVHCVDGAINMIRICREQGVDKKNLHLADLEKQKVTLPDNSFDVVTCIDGLLYLKNAPNVLGRMVRQAKPGGLIIFNAPLHIADDNTIMEFNSMAYVHSSTSLFQAIVTAGGNQRAIRADHPIKGLPDFCENMLMVVEKT
jgi:ubiquinone/menaquinone biosynthesis C-methylase UbiE